MSSVSIARGPSSIELTGGAGVKHALWGLIDQKRRWALSWKGWIAMVLGVSAVALFIFFGIQPFLAVTDRLPTETLVVEGWMDQTDLTQAAQEFRRGQYRRIFTTGGPVHGVGDYTNEYSTSAHIAAEALVALGIPREVVQSVPSRVRDRDRTYGAAVALREWLREHQQTLPSFVIVTSGMHARRSRMLFQKAFRDETTKIGVIAIPNVDYDATHWWRYSEGVKEMISEGAAYLYARLFFYPEDSHGVPAADLK